MTADGGERRGERILDVLVRVFGQELGRRRGKVRQQLVVNLLECVRRGHRARIHDLGGGRNANRAKRAPRLLFDATNDVHFSIRVHGDGGAELTRATCSAASVHERFDIVRKFVVNDQIDVRNVQSARRDVGGDENRETVIAESLQGSFALRLRDVAVKHLRRDASTESRGEFIRRALRLREANSLFILGVHGDEIHHDGGSVRVGHGARHQIDRIRDFLLGITDQINHDVLRREEPFSDSFHPARHGGGE